MLPATFHPMHIQVHRTHNKPGVAIQVVAAVIVRVAIAIVMPDLIQAGGVNPRLFLRSMCCAGEFYMGKMFSICKIKIINTYLMSDWNRDA